MSARIATRRPVILVAESQALLAIWLEDVLRAAGFDVSGPFATAADAVAAVDRLRPDAAVVSVDLREGDCFPLACALRRRDLPFLLLSGSVPAPRAFADIPQLQRPCEEADLTQRVAALLSEIRLPASRVPCPAGARLERGEAVELDQCPVACGRDNAPVSVAPFLARRALTSRQGDRYG